MVIADPSYHQISLSGLHLVSAFLGFTSTPDSLSVSVVEGVEPHNTRYNLISLRNFVQLRELSRIRIMASG
jgi:hypothetical protein